MWKFDNFSITQILREINWGCKIVKGKILDKIDLINNMIFTRGGHYVMEFFINLQEAYFKGVH